MRIYPVAIHVVLLLPVAIVLCNGQEQAPKNELGFTLGGIPSLSRSTSQESLDPGAGTAFGVNYARRFVSGTNVALYGEVNLLANPQRDVTSNIGSATKNFASLYITPGVRLKFFPTSAISPYAVVGGGYADYEQSTTRLDGQPNPASRELARGVFDSEPASMSTSGAGLLCGARLVISTQVLQSTISRLSQAGSTTWRSAADLSCAGTEWELNADQKADRNSLFSGSRRKGLT